MSPAIGRDRARSTHVLVGGKGLDHRAGMALRLLGDGLGKAFLEAACSSGVAARTWLGRGTWMVQPIVRKASQPRCSATRSRPSSAAMKAATFRALHSPPSSGGRFTVSGVPITP
jgi:hypothetical protein